jgi:hypothetical protein
MPVFWISELCLWPDQSAFMAILMVFNLWVGAGLNLRLVFNL